MAQISGKPLAGKLLLKAKEAETKTAGGIYIPDSAKEKPLQGEIVAVGGAKKDEIVEVKVGDNVLYGKYAGTEINLNGVDYLLLNQSDILFIL
jgi:chaperonin GroES